MVIDIRVVNKRVVVTELADLVVIEEEAIVLNVVDVVVVVVVDLRAKMVEEN